MEHSLRRADRGRDTRELQQIEVLRGSDILLLQEMDEHGTAAIAAALDADYVFHAADVHPKSGRDFGNAIVSRWPIVDAAEIPLPHQAPISGQPRSATRATVKVGATDVVTYSVHTEIRTLRAAKRVRQFDVIAADAGRRDAGPVVVGGDFNTVTGRDVFALRRAMERGGLAAASLDAGPTFSRGGRRFRLDHLFARGLASIAAGVAPGATASDHLPLWADLSTE